MKKNIIKTLLAGSFIMLSSQGFAKTQGSYIGIDLLNTKSSFTIKGEDGNEDFKVGDNSKTNFGLNAKYAFNFNDFFIAPGIFYDKIGTKKQLSGVLLGDETDSEVVTGKVDSSYEIKSRYGVRADFGYDLSDQFAAYLTAGLSKVNYRESIKAENFGISVNTSKTTNKVAPLFGAGLSFYPHKNIAFNVEYNIQQGVKFKSEDTGTTESKISVMKFGVAYKF